MKRVLFAVIPLFIFAVAVFAEVVLQKKEAMQMKHNFGALDFVLVFVTIIQNINGNIAGSALLATVL